MPEPFLFASEMVVRFDGLVAVNGLSLHVDRGERVGLIGTNGAGKTTSFGAMLGLVPLASGTVRIDGDDATGWPAHRRARAGIGRTFQKLEVFGSMTVRENLEYASAARRVANRPTRLFARGRPEAEQVDTIVALLGLGDVVDRITGSLPIGVNRRVELGRALCLEPALLALDEPSSGLDPDETAAMTGHIASVVHELGVGVLLIEHDMSMVTSLCDRLYVIDFGALIAEGATAEVVTREAVRRAYLGTADVA